MASTGEKAVVAQHEMLPMHRLYADAAMRAAALICCAVPGN
jgi:hypothetical protein